MGDIMPAMSETPEDLKREAEEDKIQSKGLKCRLCGSDIVNAGDLESFGKNDGLCSRCARDREER